MMNVDDLCQGLLHWNKSEMGQVDSNQPIPKKSKDLVQYTDALLST